MSLGFPLISIIALRRISFELFEMRRAQSQQARYDYISDWQLCCTRKCKPHNSHKHANSVPRENLTLYVFQPTLQQNYYYWSRRKKMAILGKLHPKFEMTFLSDNWKEETVFERKVENFRLVVEVIRITMDVYDKNQQLFAQTQNMFPIVMSSLK